MRVLIFTHDIIPEKSHLMPWRTLCEVVKFLQIEGHNASLVSLSDSNKKLEDPLFPRGTLSVNKNITYLYSDLFSLVEEFQPDVIFWPVSWRESFRRTQAVSKLNIPLIGYFSGGYYSIKTCFYALKTIGFKKTKPYLIEAIVPHFIQLFYLKLKGFKRLITMTALTAKHVVGMSWKEEDVICIPPAKELKNDLANIEGLPSAFSDWLGQRIYYLYMGPPSAIRGIFQLLEAFEIAAQENSNICLVCLFRSDAKLDSDAITDFISKMRYTDRVYSIWESVPKSLLNAFISKCHAVAMPFILVPSEIPLAIIETLQWGKPVISTMQGGTGEFVKQFGLSPAVGDINGLANAMIDLYQDKVLYQKKCLDAQAVYQHHSNWAEMSQHWLNIADMVVKVSK